MTESNGNNEPTEPVSIGIDEGGNPTGENPGIVVVAAAEEVSEPMCTQECGTVIELISNTVDQLCFMDQDDSRSSSELSSGARTESISPQPTKATMGTDGQGWQKRGRFIIWPVSLGEDRHV